MIKVLTYLHGLRGPDLLQVIIPPCGSSTASNSAMGGMSASSFPARMVANSSQAANGEGSQDTVPRRHPLKVHNIVRRGHGEGSQDTEAESALGVLGDPAA